MNRESAPERRGVPSLRALAERGAFHGYAYAYPHKTAYRRFARPLPLNEVWAEEPTDALFLYVHVPFCAVRCGFCNLFAAREHGEAAMTRYVDALMRQMTAVRSSLPQEPTIARLAIGGGTPTQLPVVQLDRIFALLEREFGVAASTVPTSVEASPETATDAHVALLRERGVERVSLGVQSFVDAELSALGRPQRTDEVERALDRLAATGAFGVNVDLIYGISGQTVASWLASIERAVQWRPAELFLYPLYVRPLTGLGRRGAVPSDLRPEQYRAGREFLLANGYRQRTMRSFVRSDLSAPTGPAYCCQDDGMIGVGAGARSYTRALHYAFDYAVGQSSVRALVDDYVAREVDGFEFAELGHALDRDDQRRRWAIQSLLGPGGLDLSDWRRRFGGELLDDLPGLVELVERGWATLDAQALALTAEGYGWSDTIGPWLYRDAVREASARWEPR
jgi:coproporphyrinogen III oxidase-like Fe-S oxidoreductase